MLTWDPMEGKSSKCFSSHSFYLHYLRFNFHSGYMINRAAIRKYKVINVLTIYQKIKNFVVLWNFNMGVNGKLLKNAISWKELTVQRNGWKSGCHCPRKGNMCGIFYVWFVEFSLQSSAALCKISDVMIFKRLLLPQFSSNSTKLYAGKYSNLGTWGIQAITFFWWSVKLKNIRHFDGKWHLSYIAIIHTATPISSGKRSGPLVNDFLNFWWTLDPRGTYISNATPSTFDIFQTSPEFSSQSSTQ